MLHTSLRRRYQINDQNLRYMRLQHNVFSDNMLAGTKSKRGKNYAKVFVTKFVWSRAFPMAKKGDAHEDLSLLFQRDGVLPKMIFDG